VISIFSRRFAEGKPVTLHGDGRQTRDFVYVRDVARANLLAATGSGAETVVANLCTGRGTSLLELVAAFRRIHGDSPAALFEPARPGDIRQSVGRNLAARRAMAFEPEWSLEDGLADSTRRGWD
jgi:UDP-glucose 4-epimerase